MKHLNVNQLSGIGLIVGSWLFMLNKADEMSQVFLKRTIPDLITGDDTFLVISGQLLLILGWYGYYKRYAPISSGAGRWALRMVRGAGTALGTGHIIAVLAQIALTQPPTSLGILSFGLLILGSLGLWLGLILFGIDALRSRALSRWSFLPLATGLSGLGFALFSEEVPAAEALLCRTLFGLGMVGLGVAMWAAPQPSTQREVSPRPVLGEPL